MDDIIAILIAAIVCLGIGIMLGENAGDEKRNKAWKKDVVERKFAHWEVNSSGETIFQWNTNIVEKLE